MSKVPSTETQLRSARAQLKEAVAKQGIAEKAINVWRGRATKAEQDAAEWKTRFDKLLERDKAMLAARSA